MKFHAIIFDMDGTLTVPCLDFADIRTELGLVTEGDLVQQIAALSPEAQDRAWAIIERHEADAALNNQIQPGAREALQRFAARGIRLAILTRNSPQSIAAFMDRFQLPIEIAVGRDFEPLKPAPDPIWHILRQWQLEPTDCLMVGDYHHDLDAGHNAGTATCFFHNPGTTSFAHLADYTVASFTELEKLVFEVP